jgi:O-antigen ligase
MYLGASLFAFVEIFVGLCVLLILQKKHLMLSIFLMGVVACIIIIYFVPDLFPRLSESNVTTERRIRIWNEAMVFIKENPLFGRGFLSYFQYAGQNPHIYQTTHAHNFAVEGLLSFGVIGSFILMLFIWAYYRKLSECKELLRNNCATTLILTISAAVLIHMTTDMTLLWVQTGLLYALIMAGVGIDEAALSKRINACAALGGKSDRKATENS